MASLKFGTSGYRGIINDTFTHTHVKAITLAIGQFLINNKKNNTPHIILGFDSRTGNDPDIRKDTSFLKTVVYYLQSLGIHVDCCTKPTPTPVISWAITHFNLDGGIIMTASHNPPEYNGIKFNIHNGAPAPTSVTSIIEEAALAHFKPSSSHLPSLSIQKNTIDYETKFATHLKTLSSSLIPSISSIKLTISIDTKHGACAPTWQAITNQFPDLNCHVIHSKPLSNFGNESPNPTNVHQLHKLQSTMATTNSSMGIANDPDGDRHIILDETGSPLTPEETTAIIAHYLIQSGHTLHALIASLASSQLIQKVAQAHQLAFFETNVGFKHFVPILESLSLQNKLGLAVESSGGFTSSTHTLEKCGFLPGLLIAGIIHDTQQPLSQIKQTILNTYGHFYFEEDSIRTTSQLSLPTQIDQLQPQFNESIQSINTNDGLKIVFSSNHWVLARPSGTEPVTRIYGETSSPEESQSLIKTMKSVVTAYQ